MKITFIIQDLFAQGAQYATAMMAKGFAQRGYEVDLIVSQYHNDMFQDGTNVPFDIPDSVNVIHLQKHKARHNIWEIRQYLKTCDSVALVCMSINYTRAVRLATIGLSTETKIVHVEHALASYNIDGSMKPVPNRFSWERLKRHWFWSKFDSVLTVSDHGNADFLRMNYDYPAEHVYTVWNPVIDQSFMEKRNRPPQHPWLVDKLCFTFISAGVLEDYKSQIYLLEAIKILKSRNVRCRLVLFGKGSYRARFEKFIADNNLEDWISLPGHSNQFPAEAKAADAFVLPSEMESFGIVIVEALACGLPVISTDAPFGPREILDNGKYGVLVPVRDSTALADAMQKRIRQGKVAPVDESWKRFSLEAAVSRYEKGIGL